MIMLIVLVTVLATGVVACGPETIDATTDEALKKSIEIVKSNMSASEKTEFENAVQVLLFSDVEDLSDLFAIGIDPDRFKLQMRDRLHGKTAEEIISEGMRVLQEREERQRQKEVEQAKKRRREALAEIDEVSAKMAKAMEDQENLKKFVIVRSRFYFHEDLFSDKPIIELVVRNDTSHPISRAYFHGVLTSPGRPVPWVAANFNYSIRGGLNPGEQVTWRLAPNRFGEWGQAPKDRPDMILAVTTTRIDGADGEPVYDASMDDIASLEERLKFLQETLDSTP